MRAEDKVEDKSLVPSDPRGVTPGSSSLARRGLIVQEFSFNAI